MNNQNQQHDQVWTVARIAERTGYPRHRIEYMINTRNINPIGWAGNTRIFDQHDVDLIICQLWRLGEERENAPRGLRARTREECASSNPAASSAQTETSGRDGGAPCDA
ncbi:MAG: hypothetical protein AAGB34_01045 [Planctomycetota bacterium]